MRLKKLLTWPVLVVGLSLPGLMNCSDAADALDGCNEFETGGTAVANLSIDAKFKSFVTAASDLQVVATNMRKDVKASCIAIASGLSADDTWTSLGDTDEALTAACNAASAKIQATLSANANTTASLTVSGGQCTVQGQAQIDCEGGCKVDATCMEGSLEARCEPGQLSVQCEGSCQGNATCEGTATVAAECQGSCEAECTGTCSGACSGTITGGCMGTCTGTCNGMATGSAGMANCAGTCEGKCTQPAASAMCTGKCEASCKGKCNGNCKLEANAMVKCGAMVSCKGGCMGTATAPKCQAELKPPVCDVEANCKASCSGSAEIKATCTKPTVKIVYAPSTDDLLKLKGLLETNLPAIVFAAKTQGQLALKAADRVRVTGTAAVSAVGTASGKAFACVGAAAQASIKASASVSVSVMASASVSGSAGSGS